MENDDAENPNRQTASNLSSSTSKIKTNEEAAKTAEPNKKAKKQKKRSLWQHWKSASRAKQIKWSAEGLIVITGILILGVYIWGNLQTKWHFEAEHRPRVVFSRPPELLGTITCNVTDKRIDVHSGKIRFWFKNIRNGDAIGVFMVPPMFKLVTERKIGIARIDKFIPSITDESCKVRPNPKGSVFPLNAGQGISVDAEQVAEAIISDPSDPPFAPNERFHLDVLDCIYYLDEAGDPHGTCATYSFIMPNGQNVFSCADSPLTGSLELKFGGYCEN
jgi:hypothetical protein